MFNPLVSIIIPVYNGSNYLKECIDSALAQTYDNIEIIVVNDGSNDGGATENIAISFLPKIKYFHKKNGGVSSALNYAIKYMNGEFFSWLSHDDLYDPYKIEKQVNIIKKFNMTNCIVFSESLLINKDGKVIKYKKTSLRKSLISGKDVLKKLVKKNVFNGCSLLIPKKVFDEVGLFNEKYKYIQDWDMWFRIALGGYYFAKVDSPLVKMRIHPNQQTLKLIKYMDEELNDSIISNVKNMLSINNKSLLIKLIIRSIKSNQKKLKNEIIVLMLRNGLLNKINVFLINLLIPFISLYGWIYKMLSKFINYIRRKK